MEIVFTGRGADGIEHRNILDYQTAAEGSPLILRRVPHLYTLGEHITLHTPRETTGHCFLTCIVHMLYNPTTLLQSIHSEEILACIR